MRQLRNAIVILFSLIMAILLVSCSPDDFENPDGSTDKLPFAKYHTVSFDTNGGNAIEAVEVINNGSLERPNAPTRANYIFESWYLDEGLTVPAIFPLKIEGNKTLYAGWLKIADDGKLADAKVKFWANNNFSASYSVTPAGFDLDKLDKKGYHFKITVTYDVYYEKDYDVPYDIGYLGAPKYEAYILNSKGAGYGEDDQTTTTTSQTRTLEFVAKISDLKDEKWMLTFATNNIQNLIYFKNITVKYECIK